MFLSHSDNWIKVSTVYIYECNLETIEILVYSCAIYVQCVLHIIVMVIFVRYNVRVMYVSCIYVGGDPIKLVKLKVISVSFCFLQNSSLKSDCIKFVLCFA